MKKRKPKEFDRRFAGLMVMAGSRCPPIAYALYEVFYDDGTKIYERGHTLRTMHGTQDLNGTKSEKEMHGISLRPEMHFEVAAAATLFGHISDECQHIDAQYAKRNSRVRRK